MCHEFAKILGEGVVIIACSRLARLAEASAVIGYNTIASSEKDGDLFLPGSPA